MKHLNEDEDLELLMDDLLRICGYDFREYTMASLKRRFRRIMDLGGFKNVAEMRSRISTDPVYVRYVVEEITVNVTEMFRDPLFFKTLRTEVIPNVIAKPFIRVWHAGCSTGEEVYSMAILLKEAGVLHKSIIYATDIHQGVVEKAKKGIFPLSQMQLYSQNYLASGGVEDFSSYYTANYDYAVFDKALAERMVFSTHNLVSDGSFNSFDIVICRNVLIYFTRELQFKVFNLFDQSLENLGYLVLGSRETVSFSGIHTRYKRLGKEKVWRKMA